MNDLGLGERQLGDLLIRTASAPTPPAPASASSPSRATWSSRRRKAYGARSACRASIGCRSIPFPLLLRWRQPQRGSPPRTGPLRLRPRLTARESAIDDECVPVDKARLVAREPKGRAGDVRRQSGALDGLEGLEHSLHEWHGRIRLIS